MVYDKHRRKPFTNNTMSQRFRIPEDPDPSRGTSGRTSNRCSTESARCVLLQQRMLQAPTHTNRQGCERADAGRDWFLRQAGWWRSWESQYRVSPRRGPITLHEACRRLKPVASRLPAFVAGLLKTTGQGSTNSLQQTRKDAATEARGVACRWGMAPKNSIDICAERWRGLARC